MKFQRRAINILFVCILLSGCGNNNAVSDMQTKESIESASFDINSEITVYDCLMQRAEREDLVTVEVHYPQIRFQTDEDKEEVADKINEQIFDYVMMDEYFQWKDARYNTELNYTVCYVGERYLSILFEGYYQEYNHPKAPSVLNFDLHTGKVIGLEEVVSLEELETLLSEEPERILESENMAVVGGKTGAIEYLWNYLQEESHMYDFSVTEKGIKVIIFSQMDDRHYAFAEIVLWD